MKKIILSVAVLALFAASCGDTANKSEGSDSTAANTEATTPAEETTASTTTSSDAPTFSNEEVNKGLAEYKTLMDEYVKAIESKDQAKMTELATKYSTWAQSAGTWASKLKPEEAQQYSEYMQKLAKDWTDAATKAAQ